ncbi:MAG: enoyl-CoA hydratase/isomerase family protein [Gemmatimonadetes bacterium]|nr:enoyl-CoA hydratase/isomerase family protein [Gemmatimonadota bacterium]
MTELAHGQHPVTSATDGHVRSLTLNRPDRLNAVSRALYEALTSAFEYAGKDDAVRCIILTGSGRAFSAGADLKAHAETPPTAAERKRYARAAQRANAAIQQCPKPVVAAVNGAAVGAGLELALSCDFIVVAEDAKLRLPELALGTFFGGGVAHTLPQRVGHARARELLFLGDFVSGARAAEIGLADVAVPADEVVDAAGELAARLAERAPVPMRLAKRLLGRAPRLSRRALMREEAAALAECMGTRDWEEGIAAFRERRAPRYTGE